MIFSLPPPAVSLSHSLSFLTHTTSFSLPWSGRLSLSSPPFCRAPSSHFRFMIYLPPRTVPLCTTDPDLASTSVLSICLGFRKSPIIGKKILSCPYLLGSLLDSLIANDSIRRRTVVELSHVTHDFVAYRA